MRVFLIVTAVLFVGCGYFARNTDRPEPEKPTPTAQERYQKAKTRLLSHFVENGYIVSRWADKSPEHEGEGILWTGVALTVLSCEDGQGLEDNLIGMVERQNGGLVRIEPLGEYAGGREITFDGAVGFYRGVASRLRRCPGSKDRWRSVWNLHLSYLEDHDGRLHANSDARFHPEFDTLRDAISHFLGLRGAPHPDRLKVLGAEIATWSTAVVVAKQPAFRLNLSLLTIQGLEDIGYGVPAAAFCTVTRGADVPTVDHYCGRADIRGFIESYQPNQWEYRHQRAGAWETPDGKVGLDTPGLDYLVALVARYELL